VGDDIWFMESDYTAGLHIRNKLLKHLCWILLKQQYVSAYERIERLFKRHFGGVALAERNVGQ